MILATVVDFLSTLNFDYILIPTYSLFLIKICDEGFFLVQIYTPSSYIKVCVVV